MRELLVIGIGPGHPDQITVQAVAALNRVDVFFVVDKGERKSGLVEARDEILRRHVRDPSRYRIVEIADPPRDRAAADYTGAVADWHAARALLFGDAIAGELGDDGVGALLVWGDPALYDSTLRVLERVLEQRPGLFTHTVLPGVTSVHALTAAHAVAINRIGEPVHVTPARLLDGGLPAGLDSAVVMLDPGFAPADWDADAARGVEVFWGAYVSTPDEVLISGPLAEVGNRIADTKRALRERHGWIMDSYLLRQPQRARPAE